jgi:glycosyltransferase involved in cell wall biosynthesis
LVIAQVIGELRIGGAERMFVDLCNALDVDKTIVVLIGDSDLQPNLRSELRRDIEVHSVRVRRRTWVKDVWTLSRLFRDAGCDVVHTHMFWPNLYGSLSARLAGVSAIITSEHGRNEWKRRWHKWVEVNVISRYADVRLCVSQDILRMRRDIDGVPEDMLRIVPNGTVVPTLQPRTEKQGTVIGSVGRLVSAKDYPMMIRAVSILVSRGVDVNLEIVGEGEEREAIEAAIRKEGVESKVTLAGSQTNVSEWLARWRIFVSSSVREGQPVALLEAMAAGLPCVVTAAGGVPDTLADGVEGIVVPPGDPEALADGIQQLLGDAEQSEICGRAARERVIEDFSIESLASTCRQIYTSVLQSKTADLVS